MRITGHKPIYNARIPTFFHFVRCLRVVSLAALVVLWVPTSSAGDWQEPCEQLAQKIIAVTGPGAIAFEVTNASSLSQPDVDDVRRRLLTELASLGVHFVNADQASATVKVTLSENLQDHVWIGEIHQGKNEANIVMVSTPRSLAIMTDHSSVGMTIHKALLWSDENRVLDVGVINGNPLHMVVLEPETIALYRLQDGRWQLEQSLTISHPNPWPRDLRGRLTLRKDHLFDAYLPGVFCQSTTVAPLGLSCRESDDPWPVGTEQFPINAFFAPTRNFFTGVLSPGLANQTVVPPFFTAAALPREKYTLWLFATVDGQVHLLDGVTDQRMTNAQLSDLAAVHSSCGLGWQILAAHGTDSNDVIAAFEFRDREPVPVSQPVEFNGVVTALWAESDGTTAIAVLQNRETRQYEAYRLSIICGQ